MLTFRPQLGPQSPGAPGVTGGSGAGTGPARTGSAGTGPGEGGRLGLLLGYAGWREHSWADSLPTLLAPMGITAHRATSGQMASSIISATPIHIAVVDLGLPMEDVPAGQPVSENTVGKSDEGGPRLLEMLRRLAQPPHTVVIKRRRGARDERRDVAAALKLGAFAVIDPPAPRTAPAPVAPVASISSGELEVLLEVLRRILYRHYQGRWPETNQAGGDPRRVV